MASGAKDVFPIFRREPIRQEDTRATDLFSTPVKTQSSTTPKIVTPIESKIIEIFTVDEAEPAGVLHILSKKKFNKKYTGKGTKQKIIDIQGHNGIVSEESISEMREPVREKKQQCTNSSISNNINVRPPDALTRYETFSVEFGDFAAQIPRLFRTNADVFEEAGVVTRSKRKPSEQNKDSEAFVQWANKKYLISEWNGLLTSWEQKYFEIKTKRKRGDDELIANKERESLKQFRDDCWSRLRPVWPGKAGVVTTHQNNKQNIPVSFKDKYKLDIWGNVVTKDVRFSII